MMRKRDIMEELKYLSMIGTGLGTFIGAIHSEKGNWNTLKGAMTGFKKSLEPTYDLLQEYISTSNYEYIQKSKSFKLKILNKKYLMETISDKINSNRYASSSLKHINNNLEVAIQFTERTSPIRIELSKKEGIYIPIKAMYGKYTIYSRI